MISLTLQLSIWKYFNDFITFTEEKKWRQVECSTGLILTIEIEDLLFDNNEKLGCSTQIMFNGKLQLSKITSVEHPNFRKGSTSPKS